jgi:hypothetical protein
MLKTRSAQVGLFDAAVVMGPLPEGSFFALLAEHGDRIVRDCDFAECYSERMGRPSIPPSLLAKVLLWQHRTGVSNEQAMECVGWDLRWKVALGLAVDHRGWHPTSLTKFRARLLLHKKERRKGWRWRTRCGSPPSWGYWTGGWSRSWIPRRCLAQPRRRTPSGWSGLGSASWSMAVTAVDRDAGGRLRAGLEFDYARPGEKPDCQWRIKAERERMLTRVAQDAQRALLAVEQAQGLLDDEPVKAAYELLAELVGQDFDVDPDGVPRLHRGTRPGRIISTIDPELRHGRESSQTRFDGYKLSAAVSNSSEPLIMTVHVAPAGETDGPQAKHLIDNQPPDRRPQRILGDTAYGNGVVRSELAERDVEVLAPVPEGTVLEDRLGRRDFSIDLRAGTVTCPGGQTAAITTSPQGARAANFSRTVCGGCALKDRCCPGRPNRHIALGEHEQFLLAARQALNDPATAAHLRHTRPRIERLLGLLVHRYGARKSRYIGSDKARLQASWPAALVNLNPIGHHLATGTA